MKKKREKRNKRRNNVENFAVQVYLLAAQHETRRIIFSAIARKKGIIPVNVRRRSIDDVKPISHFSFFLAVGARLSNADNKRSPV